MLIMESNIYHKTHAAPSDDRAQWREKGRTKLYGSAICELKKKRVKDNADEKIVGDSYMSTYS